MPTVIPINIEAANPSGTHFNIFRFASLRLFVNFSKYPTAVKKIQKIKIIARTTSLVFSIKSILIPSLI